MITLPRFLILRVLKEEVNSSSTELVCWTFDFFSILALELLLELMLSLTKLPLGDSVEEVFPSAFESQ